MDGNPYSGVYETLSEVLATKAIPLGGPARLYRAIESLRDTGDAERSSLVGRASVALLCLEHAIREGDFVRQQRAYQKLETIFEAWVAIPLAETGIFVPCDLAA
jgi:hypothetical protein